MQLMPSTAAVNIPNISKLENDIHAGVKYLHWIRANYYSDPKIAPLDRVLFSFAAYNAGPGNMMRARRRANRLGFNPNRLFGHVEIGMYRAVSGEPDSYVRNIYKYYVIYQGLEKSRQAREIALQGHSRNRLMEWRRADSNTLIVVCLFIFLIGGIFYWRGKRSA
jgi:membrane-bound lytic murein transglycosylase MltF